MTEGIAEPCRPPAPRRRSSARRCASRWRYGGISRASAAQASPRRRPARTSSANRQRDRPCHQTCAMGEWTSPLTHPRRATSRHRHGAGSRAAVLDLSSSPARLGAAQRGGRAASGTYPSVSRASARLAATTTLRGQRALMRLQHASCGLHAAAPLRPLFDTTVRPVSPAQSARHDPGAGAARSTGAQHPGVVRPCATEITWSPHIQPGPVNQLPSRAASLRMNPRHHGAGRSRCSTSMIGPSSAIALRHGAARPVPHAFAQMGRAARGFKPVEGPATSATSAAWSYKAGQCPEACSTAARIGQRPRSTAHRQRLLHPCRVSGVCAPRPTGGRRWCWSRHWRLDDEQAGWHRLVLCGPSPRSR